MSEKSDRFYFIIHIILFSIFWQIKDLPSTDTNFIGSSQVGAFVPGGSSTISVTFTTNNDSTPEVEQTFIFQLSVAGQSGVTVNKPDKAVITINANDEAYGIFKFTDVSLF